MLTSYFSFCILEGKNWKRENWPFLEPLPLFLEISLQSHDRVLLLFRNSRSWMRQTVNKEIRCLKDRRREQDVHRHTGVFSSIAMCSVVCLWMCLSLSVHTHLYTHSYRVHAIIFFSHITGSRVSHKQSDTLQDRHCSFSPVPATALCLQLCGLKPSYFLTKGWDCRAFFVGASRYMSTHKLPLNTILF